STTGSASTRRRATGCQHTRSDEGRTAASECVRPGGGSENGWATADEDWSCEIAVDGDGN
uniref:Uncharacterized protein n=1 Tax=Cucumis melo TaxID=3656 RepID=A0A9I9CCU3_CUCME